MNQAERDVVYQKAIAKWGTSMQLKMVAEECAELIKAVLKLDRTVNGSDFQSVREEMADVHIMLEQLEFIVGRPDIIKEIKKKKLERLKELVG